MRRWTDAVARNVSCEPWLRSRHHFVGQQFVAVRSLERAGKFGNSQAFGFKHQQLTEHRNSSRKHWHIMAAAFVAPWGSAGGPRMVAKTATFPTDTSWSSFWSSADHVGIRIVDTCCEGVMLVTSLVHDMPDMHAVCILHSAGPAAQSRESRATWRQNNESRDSQKCHDESLQKAGWSSAKWQKTRWNFTQFISIYAMWAEVCAEVPTARPMVCLFDLFGLTGPCSALERVEDTHPYNLGVHPIFRQTQQGHFPPRSYGYSRTSFQTSMGWAISHVETNLSHLYQTWPYAPSMLYLYIYIYIICYIYIYII